MVGIAGKIWYCDETCQRKHWKTHKKTCAGRKKKRAAQAAAAERHLRPDDAEDVPVTWEDQQRINKFGRLVLRKTELQDELKKDETELANLEDAQGEIEMLMDDDACRARVGEMFVHVSNEDAEEFVEKKLAETKEIVAKKKAQVSEMNDELNQLKSVLYAKFGKSINLEAETDN
eukprot:TRINITY_DN66705_c2_g4_i1.p1 TRINITY_DN66705_c2_g4~~TRINITY_DN66705_c2_g4_i1.p1  ORF type:complete len:175 (-),score=108.83 TRINITY_DN66705_c2_g4_i1:69-593(-)